MAQQARLADLTVVPHPDAGEDVSSSDALHAGTVRFRPAGADLAAGAAHHDRHARLPGLERHGGIRRPSVLAAMPWMQRAEAVRILSADGYQRRGPAAPELAAYLALHGMRADIVMFQSISNSVGAGLLAAAQASSAATCCRWAPTRTRGCASSFWAA